MISKQALASLSDELLGVALELQPDNPSAAQAIRLMGRGIVAETPVLQPVDDAVRAFRAAVALAASRAASRAMSRDDHDPLRDLVNLMAP